MFRKVIEVVLGQKMCQKKSYQGGFKSHRGMVSIVVWIRMYVDIVYLELHWIQLERPTD